MADLESCSSNTRGLGSRCRNCAKCLRIQRRIAQVEMEYGQLRAYFVKQAKPPMIRFRGADPEGKEMCDEIAQLKVTLDTLVRSQLFEVLEQA